MLNVEDTVLLVIDIQGKLAELMYERDRLFDSAGRLIQGAGVLEVPIIWTEQNPDGLGPTVAPIASLLDPPAIPKRSFSCWGEPRFVEEMKKLNRRQVLLSGIETHVCVYQTAADLLEQGYDVHVVSDAVSSRTAENRRIGLRKMEHLGAAITSVECALFELLRVAEGDKFKAILRIVK